MKFTTTLIVLFSVIFSNTIIAQDYYVYDPTNPYYRANQNMFNPYLNSFSRINTNTFFTTTNSFRFVLNSDPSTKSVLVSNVIADKAGNLSPLIGAATWKDNGKNFMCRSLLEFNLELLPIEIRNDPSLIQSAELILYPSNVNFGDHDNEKPGFIYVRQVLENWIDSITSWDNQPVSDSAYQVSFLQVNKLIPANIDVTTLVKKMIRKENNGFMLVHNNAMNESLSAGQLFASPKNIDSSLRPQLLVYFEISKRQLKNIGYDFNYTRSIQPYWYVQRNLMNDGRNYSGEGPTKLIGTYPSGTHGSTSTNSTGNGYGHNSPTVVPSSPSTSTSTTNGSVKPIRVTVRN